VKMLKVYFHGKFLKILVDMKKEICYTLACENSKVAQGAAAFFIFVVNDYQIRYIWESGEL